MTEEASYGIASQYRDAFGNVQAISQQTRQALLAAMHLDPRQPAPTPPAPLYCVPAGHRARLGPGTVRLEDGTELSIDRSLPADLPPGYHSFAADRGAASHPLIVHPQSCLLPDDLRCWGWAVPLYATRSRSSWGIGDLADLRRLGHWSRSLGAQLLMINPLCASTPTVPQEPSPYQPSSRMFRSPLYLRIEEIPGADDRHVEELAEAGRALNAQRRIDRDQVFQLKMEALGRIWSPSRQEDPGLKRFVSDGGENLTCYATYCVLAEKFGADWRQWDSDYRRPDAPAVTRFRRAHAERIAFHQWVQWQLDEQMGRAAQELPLLTDLPIGCAPTGADAWMWQDTLAIGASMGAPPDRYNPQGQDWGAAPLVPHCLRQAGYQPLIAVIRATMRHARGLRIDHAMGLFRQFWIPQGMPPQQGAFVMYPSKEILGILALESHRNGVWVAGEDLGTVEPEMRKELAAQNILSHRLLWFEDDPPSKYPRRTLAAATTHDLSTIVGAWTGTDAEDERRLGRHPRQEYIQQIRDRLERAVKLGPDAPLDQVIVAAHRALAQAPSAVLVANLTDALAVTERLNMPGQSSWPNWSLALPLPLEEIQQAELPRRVAQAMQR